MQPEIQEVQEQEQTIRKATVVVEDAVSRVHFHFTQELVNALTWEEYEAIELAQDGETKIYKLRPLLVRFMVDEDGKFMNPVLASKMLAKVPVIQIPEIIQRFVDALRVMTVPKENGTSSKSPSVANQED